MTAYYNEHDPSRFIAYVITNAVNGKQYVGVTVRGLRRRWKCLLTTRERR